MHVVAQAIQNSAYREDGCIENITLTCVVFSFLNCYTQSMRRLYNMLQNRTKTLQGAALILAIFTFSSQLLGLVRDRLFASYVGLGSELDAYYYAFKIPDMLYAFFAALVSVTVLIPLLSKAKLHAEGEAYAKKTYDVLYTVFTIGSMCVVTLVSICMPYLVKLIAPGVTDTVQISNIILYSRLLLLQPILLGISNLFGSYTQMSQKFIIYAISPLIYNISIVLSIIWLYPIYGMLGVVYGVLIGSVLHASIQVPYIHKNNFLPRLRRIYYRDMSIVKEVLTHSVPRAFILSLVQLQFLFMNSIASFQASGNTSTLNLANNLQSVPMSLIGVSFVVASFPILSKTFAEKDETKFWATYQDVSKKIIIYTLLATIGLWFLKEPLVYILLANSSQVLAVTFGLFILSLTPQCIQLLITRTYYARGDTKKAAYLNIYATILTIALIYSIGNSVEYIALAFTIGSWVSCGMFWISLEKYRRVRMV
jgi:putative peptidoglycan lipid II flippase